MSPLAGVLHALATLRDTLNGPPQPECTAHCQCALQGPLGHISSLITAAQQATTARKCKRTVDSAWRAARALSTRIGALVKRHCIAPPALATALQQETSDLTNQSKALFKSRYCAGK